MCSSWGFVAYGAHHCQTVLSFLRLEVQEARCCGYDFESDRAGNHRLHSGLERMRENL